MASNFIPYDKLQLIDQLFIKNNPLGYIEELKQKGIKVDTSDFLATYSDNIDKTKIPSVKRLIEKESKPVVDYDKIKGLLKNNISSEIRKQIEQDVASKLDNLDELKARLETERSDFARQELQQQITLASKLRMFDIQQKYIQDMLDIKLKARLSFLEKSGALDTIAKLIEIEQVKQPTLTDKQIVDQAITNKIKNTIQIVDDEQLLKDTKDTIKDNTKAINLIDKGIQNLQFDIQQAKLGRGIPRAYSSSVSSYITSLETKISNEEQAKIRIQEKLDQNTKLLNQVNERLNNTKPESLKLPKIVEEPKETTEDIKQEPTIDKKTEKEQKRLEQLKEKERKAQEKIDKENIKKQELLDKQEKAKLEEQERQKKLQDAELEKQRLKEKKDKEQQQKKLEKEKQIELNKQRKEQFALEREQKLFGNLTSKQKMDFDGTNRAYAGAISQTPKYDKDKDYKLVDVFDPSEFPSDFDTKKFAKQSSWVQIPQGYARVYDGKIIAIFGESLPTKESAIAFKDTFKVDILTQYEKNKQQYEIDQKQARREAQDKWLLERKKEKLIEKGITEVNGVPVTEIDDKTQLPVVPYDRANEDQTSKDRRHSKIIEVNGVDVKLYLDTKKNQYTLIDPSEYKTDTKKHKVGTQRLAFAIKDKLSAYRGKLDQDGNQISKGRFNAIKYTIKNKENKPVDLDLKVKLEVYKPEVKSYQKLEDYNRPIDLDEKSKIQLINKLKLDNEKEFTKAVDNLYTETGDSEELKKAEITKKLNNEILATEKHLEDTVKPAFRKDIKDRNPSANSDTIEQLVDSEFAKFMRSAITNGKFIESVTKDTEQLQLSHIEDVKTKNKSHKNHAYEQELKDTLKNLPYDVKLYKGIVVAIVLDKPVDPEVKRKLLIDTQLIVNKQYQLMRETDATKREEIINSNKQINDNNYKAEISRSINEFYLNRPIITPEMRATFGERKQSRINKRLDRDKNRSLPFAETDEQSYIDYLLEQQAIKEENRSLALQYEQEQQDRIREKIAEYDARMRMEKEVEDNKKRIATRLADKLNDNIDKLKDNLKNSSDLLAELSKVDPQDPQAIKLNNKVIEYKVENITKQLENTILKRTIDKYVDVVSSDGYSNEIVQEYYKFDRARKVLQKNGIKTDSINKDFENRLKEFQEIEKALYQKPEDKTPDQIYNSINKGNTTIEDMDKLKGTKYGLAYQLSAMKYSHNFQVNSDIAIPKYELVNAKKEIVKDKDGKIVYDKIQVLDQFGRPEKTPDGDLIFNYVPKTRTISVIEEIWQTNDKSTVKYGSKEYYDLKQIFVRDLMYVDAKIQENIAKNKEPSEYFTRKKEELMSSIANMTPTQSPFEIKQLDKKVNQLMDNYSKLKSELDKVDDNLSIEDAQKIYDELKDKTYKTKNGNYSLAKFTSSSEIRSELVTQQHTFDTMVDLVRRSMGKSDYNATYDDLLVKKSMEENKELLRIYNEDLPKAKKLIANTLSSSEINDRLIQLDRVMNDLDDILLNAYSEGSLDDDGFITDKYLRQDYDTVLKRLLTDAQKTEIEKNPNKFYDETFRQQILKDADKRREEYRDKLEVTKDEYKKGSYDLELSAARQLVKEYGKYISVEHLLINEDEILRGQLRDRRATEERFVKQYTQDYEKILFTEKTVNERQKRIDELEDRIIKKTTEQLQAKLNDELKDLNQRKQELENNKTELIAKQDTKSNTDNLKDKARQIGINSRVSMSASLKSHITPALILETIRATAGDNSKGGGLIVLKDDTKPIRFRSSGEAGKGKSSEQFRNDFTRELLTKLLDKNFPTDSRQIAILQTLHGLKSDAKDIEKVMSKVKEQIINQMMLAEETLATSKKSKDQKQGSLKDASYTSMFTNAFYETIHKEIDDKYKKLKAENKLQHLSDKEIADSQNQEFAEKLAEQMQKHITENLRPILDSDSSTISRVMVDTTMTTGITKQTGLDEQLVRDTLAVIGTVKNEKFDEFVRNVLDNDIDNIDLKNELGESVKKLDEQIKQLGDTIKDATRKHQENVDTLVNSKTSKKAEMLRKKALEDFKEFVKSNNPISSKPTMSFSEAIYNVGVQKVNEYNAKDKAKINSALEKGRHQANMQANFDTYNEIRENELSQEFDTLAKIIFDDGKVYLNPTINTESIKQLRKHDLKGRFGINQKMEMYSELLKQATKALYVPGKPGRPKKGTLPDAKITELDQMRSIIEKMGDYIQDNISPAMISSYDNQLKLMNDNYGGIIGLLQLYGDGSGRMPYVDEERLLLANKKLQQVNTLVYDKIFSKILATFMAVPNLTDTEAMNLANISAQKLISQMLDSDPGKLYNATDTQIKDMTSSIFVTLENLASYKDETQAKAVKDTLRKIRESKTDIQALFLQNDALSLEISDTINQLWDDKFDYDQKENPMVMDSIEFKRLLRSYHSLSIEHDFTKRETIKFFDKAKDEYVRFMTSYIDDSVLQDMYNPKNANDPNDSRLIKDLVQRDGNLIFNYQGEEIILGDSTSGYIDDRDIRETYSADTLLTYADKKQNYTIMQNTKNMTDLANTIYTVFDTGTLSFTSLGVEESQLKKTRELMTNAITKFASEFVNNILSSNEDIIRATTIYALEKSGKKYTKEQVDELVNTQVLDMMGKYQSDLMDNMKDFMGNLNSWVNNRIETIAQLNNYNDDDRRRVIASDKTNFLRTFLLGEDPKMPGLLDLMTGNKFKTKDLNTIINLQQSQIVRETMVNMYKATDVRVVQWRLDPSHKWEGGKEICEIYSLGNNLTPEDKLLLSQSGYPTAGLYSVSLIPKRTHANCRCYTYAIVDGTTMNNLEQAFINYRTQDQYLLSMANIIVAEDSGEVPF
ncbi:hypothetical protein UFOVP755_63 [uncultured Caudovirales phage]|uniref:Uncharacterized protein n=1 Tax=uncultured Caudovirales phage TaxID=2100421 RepID=A0A6J7X5N3_9CAUD|nr:hypothetical protein UFOVP755_63 [uncultured Caudovirales phage]